MSGILRAAVTVVDWKDILVSWFITLSLTVCCLDCCSLTYSLSCYLEREMCLGCPSHVQGVYRSWNVIKIIIQIFEAWKIMESALGHLKSWKINQMVATFLTYCIRFWPSSICCLV